MLQAPTLDMPIWRGFARPERGKRMTGTERTYTIGQLVIAAAIPLGMWAMSSGVSALIYSLNHGLTGDETKQQVVDLRGDMNKRFDDQAAETNKRFDILASQIIGLPTQAAQLERLKTENDELKTRLGQDEARLQLTDRAAYDANQAATELAKRVEQLTDKVNAPVGLRATR